MNGVESGTADYVLEVQNVSKYFGSRRTPAVVALKDATIRVKRGEFISLLGPSGCGKTTLFNMIAGLIEPSEGRIKIDGKDVTGKAGHVGYMLQKDLLLPWRTVIKNVTLGAQLLNRDVAAAEKEARALLERFGLKGFENAWPANLSGGMRQRAAVMRTLLSGRDILLLDEPFGALDAMTRANMQEWLLDIWQESGRTVVFVTHDIDEAIFLSDRIVVMGARPGSVRLELDVAIQRPRVADDVESAAYRADLKHRILSVIHGKPQETPQGNAPASTSEGVRS